MAEGTRRRQCAALVRGGKLLAHFMALAIAPANLGLLAVVKYADLVANILNTFLASLGQVVPGPRIPLPLGTRCQRGYHIGRVPWCPLGAHCRLGLGKLSGRTGRASREHVATATMMYRDMGMGHWLVQAKAEMRQLQ